MSSNTIYQSNKIYYSYLIKFLPTGQLYYGVRYSKNSNPNDFWVKYKSSSATIKNLLKLFGESAFHYEVRFTSSSKSRILKLERRVLTKFNAKFSFNWLNLSNGYSNKFSDNCDYFKGFRWYHNPITFDEYRCTYKTAKRNGYILGKTNKTTLIPSKSNNAIIYIPKDGVLISTVKKYTQSQPCSKVFGICLHRPILLKSLPKVPLQFKIKITDGSLNITWDSRLPYPNNKFYIGYTTSDKEKIRRSIYQLSVIHKPVNTNMYKFLHIQSNKIFEGIIFDFNKISNVSKNDISSLIYERQNSAKGWSIYLPKVSIWSHQKKKIIPETKSFICNNCKKSIKGKSNLNRWHNDNCKSISP